MTKPPSISGGPAAVSSAMRHAVSRMGVLRAFQALKSINQFSGFDCPGCGWPEPDDRRGLVEFCENGAKAVSDEAMDWLADAAFLSKHPLDELLKRDDAWLSQQGRLGQPLVRRKGATHFEAIGWDKAFALVAGALKALPSPDAAAFYAGGRTGNEAAFLLQLLARMYGTNNLPDAGNVCHEPSGIALQESLGVGTGTVRLSDFDHADCILVLGLNPGTSHPRMLTALQAAARRGCAIVSVNPLPEAGLASFRNPQELSGWMGKGTPLAGHHLQVRINGDVALLKGLAKELLFAESEAPGSVLDDAFLRGHTEGFEAYRAALAKVDLAEVEYESGVPVAAIREVGRLLARSKRVIACWGTGLTQHENAVANVQELVNLLLLGGHLGREGAGLCPVRSHSNGQGVRTMGVGVRPNEAFLSALGREFGFEPPRTPGRTWVETLRGMQDGTVQVLVALGGNLLAASPDAAAVEQALRKCALAVHVGTKLNRAHLVAGEVALVLPSLSRIERDVQEHGAQFVTVENTMGVVTASRGKLEPVSPDLRSEVAIIAGLAAAVLGSEKVKWGELAADHDLVRAHISRVVPGFQDFTERVQKPGGFYAPNAVRDGRKFGTESGKAHFVAHPLPRTEAPEGKFTLMVLGTHAPPGATEYGMQDRERGVADTRRVVLINELDLAAHGLTEGTKVDLYSHFRPAGAELEEIRNARGFTARTYPIPRGCLAAYAPEANALVPLDRTALGSGTPAFKSVVVTLRPSDGT